MIYTSGENQNSYLSLEDANVLLLSMAPSFLGDGYARQLGIDDEELLIEAAQDLEAYWSWNGQPSSADQVLAWPRRYVEKPGFRRPGEPGWSAPYCGDAWLRFKIDFLTPGFSAVPYLDAETVPLQVRQAQALLALLRKAGKSLFSDSQGDTQGLQLDVGFKIAYANPTRDAHDITKRLAGLGWFVGDQLARI